MLFHAPLRPPPPPPPCLLHRVVHRRRRRRRGIRAPPSRLALQQHFFRQCGRRGPLPPARRPRPRQPKVRRRGPAAPAAAAAKGRPPAHSAAQNWRHSIARQKVCSARFQLAGLPLHRQGRIGTGRAGAPSDCKFFGSAAAASLTAPDTRPCSTWGPGTASTPRPCPNCVRIPPWPQPGASGRPAGRLFVTQCTTRLVKACGGVCLRRRTLSLDPSTAVWRGPRLCGASLVSAALGSDANADGPPAAGRRLARKRGRNGIAGARAAPRHTEHAAWKTACARAFRPDRNARLRRLARAAARSPDRARRALDSPAGGLPRSARLRNARSAHRGRRAPGGAPPAVA